MLTSCATINVIYDIPFFSILFYYIIVYLYKLYNQQCGTNRTQHKITNMNMCVPERLRFVRKDGKLAWAICLCSFVTRGIVLGIDSSFGVLIASLAANLQVSMSTIAWVQSVRSSQMFMFASISSILLRKCGWRPIIIVGTTLSCVACAGAGFSNTAVYLLFTYSIIGGAGAGLLYTTAINSGAYYFEQHKAVATGLATSGDGLGTICISLLAWHINLRYGVDAYFFALGAIFTLTLPFGFLASPVNNAYYVDIPSSPSCPAQQNEDGSSSLSISDATNHDDRSRANDVATTDEYRTFWTAFKLLKDFRMSIYCMVHVAFELGYYVPLIFFARNDGS